MCEGWLQCIASAMQGLPTLQNHLCQMGHSIISELKWDHFESTRTKSQSQFYACWVIWVIGPNLKISFCAQLCAICTLSHPLSAGSAHPLHVWNQAWGPWQHSQKTAPSFWTCSASISPPVSCRWHLSLAQVQRDLGVTYGYCNNCMFAHCLVFSELGLYLTLSGTDPAVPDNKSTICKRVNNT